MRLDDEIVDTEVEELPKKPIKIHIPKTVADEALTVDRISQTLLESAGNFKIVAQKLKVPYKTLIKFVDANPVIQEDYEISRRELVASLEARCISAVEEPVLDANGRPLLDANGKPITTLDKVHLRWLLERLAPETYGKKAPTSLTQTQVNINTTQADTQNTEKSVILIDGIEVNV